MKVNAMDSMNHAKVETKTLKNKNVHQMLVDSKMEQEWVNAINFHDFEKASWRQKKRCETGAQDKSKHWRHISMMDLKIRMK